MLIFPLYTDDDKTWLLPPSAFNVKIFEFFIRNFRKGQNFFVYFVTCCVWKHYSCCQRQRQRWGRWCTVQNILRISQNSSLQGKISAIDIIQIIMKFYIKNRIINLIEFILLFTHHTNTQHFNLIKSNNTHVWNFHK